MSICARVREAVKDITWETRWRLWNFYRDRVAFWLPPRRMMTSEDYTEALKKLYPQGTLDDIIYKDNPLFALLDHEENQG